MTTLDKGDDFTCRLSSANVSEHKEIIKLSVFFLSLLWTRSETEWRLSATYRLNKSAGKTFT